jgi:hypothetical protein
LQAEVQALCRARSPLTDDAELAARADAIIATGPWLDGPAQLDIYRRQYWLRHEDALSEDHPGLRRVLGDEAFVALMHDFFAKEAPRRRSLRDVADGLEAFLASWPGLEAGSAELAADMLSYELALVQLFDAPSAPTLEADAIAGRPPEALTGARLVLSPLVRRLSLRYPVQRWLHESGDQAAEPRLSAAPRIEEDEPSGATLELVVFRRGLTLSTETLSSTQAALLDALGSGVTIAEACVRAAEGLAATQLAELSCELPRWLEAWTRAGFFSEISLPSSTPSEELPS